MMIDYFRQKFFYITENFVQKVVSFSSPSLHYIVVIPLTISIDSQYQIMNSCIYG